MEYLIVGTYFSEGHGQGPERIELLTDMRAFCKLRTCEFPV